MKIIVNLLKTSPDKWRLPNLRSTTIYRHLLRLAALLVCHSRGISTELQGPDGYMIEHRVAKVKV